MMEQPNKFRTTRKPQASMVDQVATTNPEIATRMPRVQHANPLVSSSSSDETRLVTGINSNNQPKVNAVPCNPNTRANLRQVVTAARESNPRHHLWCRCYRKIWSFVRWDSWTNEIVTPSWEPVGTFTVFWVDHRQLLLRLLQVPAAMDTTFGNVSWNANGRMWRPIRTISNLTSWHAKDCPT